MTQSLHRLKESASQTGGPYVHIGTVPNFVGLTGVYSEDLGTRIYSDGVKGERITITGTVTDGAGNLVNDCIVELWQADAAGVYPSPADHRGPADPEFFGFGRCATNESGVYHFETIKPGPVPHEGGLMAPHITLWLAARGINIGLHTRMYFSDEEQANAADPILARARPLKRAHTLIGRREGSTVHFDIRLQGDDETVFFDV